MAKQLQEDHGEATMRGRIIEAAFTAFMKEGFAATSTAEIAKRARVSKRDIYSSFGNKQDILIACIGERAGRLRVPTDLPRPHDRKSLVQLLTSFGEQLVREISDPTVIAVFRLAIAEAGQTREVAQILDTVGRETARKALAKIMSEAVQLGLVEGKAVELSEQFSGLLWGNFMVSLLLGVAKRPSPQEIAIRARNATAAFLLLNQARGRE